MTDTELASVLLVTATREGSEIIALGPFVTTGRRTFLALDGVPAPS